MKLGKISYIEFIVLFFLAIHLLLFTSSHAFYFSNTLALDTDISDKKLQTGPENTSLVGTTSTTTHHNNNQKFRPKRVNFFRSLLFI